LSLFSSLANVSRWLTGVRDCLGECEQSWRVRSYLSRSGGERAEPEEDPRSKRVTREARASAQAGCTRDPWRSAKMLATRKNRRLSSTRASANHVADTCRVQKSLRANVVNDVTRASSTGRWMADYASSGLDESRGSRTRKTRSSFLRKNLLSVNNDRQGNWNETGTFLRVHVLGEDFICKVRAQRGIAGLRAVLDIE